MALALFSNFFKKKPFFNTEEEARIVEGIQEAERRTSGEIRVFVESKCRYVDPVDRAIEVFFGLEMDETADRNGVLIYIATKHRQMAVFGDEGIHQRVGSAFWEQEIKKMLEDFNHTDYVSGIRKVIADLGEVLHLHFPYQKDDKNELPDSIVFGR